MLTETILTVALVQGLTIAAVYGNRKVIREYLNWRKGDTWGNDPQFQKDVEKIVKKKLALHSWENFLTSREVGDTLRYDNVDYKITKAYSLCTFARFTVTVCKQSRTLDFWYNMIDNKLQWR